MDISDETRMLIDPKTGFGQSVWVPSMSKHSIFIPDINWRDPPLNAYFLQISCAQYFSLNLYLFSYLSIYIYIPIKISIYLKTVSSYLSFFLSFFLFIFIFSLISTNQYIFYFSLDSLSIVRKKNSKIQ